MSTTLLNLACDTTGKSDHFIINFLNNRNIIPPSIVYILILRNASALVESCVTVGFILDQNCMNIAFIMLNSHIINLCLKQGLTPESEDVSKIINRCTYGYRYREKKNIGMEDDLTSNYLYNKNNMFKIINHFYYGGKMPENLYNKIYYPSKTNSNNYSSNYSYAKELCNLLYTIPKITHKIGKYQCTYDKSNIINCLNTLLKNNYIMTSDNWKAFDDSILSINDIHIDNKIEQTRFLCLQNKNKNDIFTFIKKKKLTLDKTCL